VSLNCTVCNIPAQYEPLVIREVHQDIKSSLREIALCRGCAQFVLSVHEEARKPPDQRHGPLPIVGISDAGV
jgi:hypothetical protein